MPANGSIDVVLLGLAQDAGVPQIGCQCENCQIISGPCGWPVSVAIIDNANRKYWIIDATPKFPEQYNWLYQKYSKYDFSGIFLTHAHIGHYTGLMYLGREAMSTNKTPVYASRLMQAFIKQNAPWSQLVELNNIQLFDLEPRSSISLADGLSIMPIRVNHRSEFSDTFAYLISGEKRNLFYCPDIDEWHELNLDNHLRIKDYALLDGTFGSENELPGRNLIEIPHPFIRETIAFVAGSAFTSWVIHFNHSNPIWQQSSIAEEVKSAGVFIPNFGQMWSL